MQLNQKPQKLSIIVPIYNEARHIRSLVPLLYAAPCPLSREWIFVDDGSNDETYEHLLMLNETYSFILIRHQKNKGKGAAVRSGISAATGDFILIQDADFEYSPLDIPKMLSPLLQGNADAVYGSRFLTSESTAVHFAHRGINKFLTSFSNVATRLKLTDMETGYKVFKKDFLQSQTFSSQRFGIEIEMTARAAQKEIRVIEVPISYNPRSYSEGKKIGWKDGMAALWHIIYFNFIKKTQ